MQVKEEEEEGNRGESCEGITRAGLKGYEDVRRGGPTLRISGPRMHHRNNDKKLACAAPLHAVVRPLQITKLLFFLASNNIETLAA